MVNDAKSTTKKDGKTKGKGKTSQPEIEVRIISICIFTQHYWNLLLIMQQLFKPFAGYTDVEIS